MYCEISRVVKARIARVPKARVQRGALTSSDISQYTSDNIILSYASAHAHESSNHSYVSMNMDSDNDRKLFSLLYPDTIYRSFFDDGVYESRAPLLELPISPSTNLAESSPRHKMIQPDRTVAAPRTITLAFYYVHYWVHLAVLVFMLPGILLYYLTCTVKYHESSRHVSHECDAVPALTTGDISQYALDNVFIICQCACAWL